MVGFQQVLLSNHDTQVSIKSYHGALKHWFSLETKKFQGRQIDWLVWRLMHKAKMKKKLGHKK